MIVLPHKPTVQEKQVEILAVDAAESGKMLGVCEKNVRNLAKQGKITCKRIG